MPRQNRKYPRKLSRFNYWNIVGTTPQDADELKTFSPSWVRKYSHGLAGQQFHAHLASEPSGVVGCTPDEEIRNTNGEEQRTILALERYVKMDQLWNQDASAQTVLASFRPTVRAKLKQLDQKVHATKRRNFIHLLKKIARDQKVFELILAENCAGDPACISDRHGLSEAQIVNIYRAYSAQRQLLMGKVTSHRVLEMLERRGIEHTSLSKPIIPQWRLINDATANPKLVGHDEQGEPVYEYVSSPMFDCDGKLIDYDHHGEPIDATARNKMVLHWFAHALRNLSRYSQGHPPLPFQDSCAEDCLKERDRLARIGIQQK